MKKLTLALLSLMLFLGMGTAFAQLPTPTFTPRGGMMLPTQVTPGQEIEVSFGDLDLEDNGHMGAAFILYSFYDEEPDDTPEFTTTVAELYGVMQQFMPGGGFGSYTSSVKSAKAGEAYQYAFYYEMGDGPEPLAPITVPEDAGTYWFYARLALIGEDEEGDEIVEYSDMVEDNIYQVEGEAVKLAMPTFNPGAGAVDPGTTVTINTPEGADFVWYTTTDDGEPTQAKYDKSWFEYTKPITINQNTTLRAASVKGDRPPFTFSEVAEAVYTVTGEATNIPKLTLNPTGVISVNGSTVFSCALAPQTYTHSSGKLGFLLALKNGGGIAKLEYQVADAVAEDGWTEYKEADLKQLINGTTLGAIPNASNNAAAGRVITIEAKTVWYRLTLSDNATAEAEAVFSVVECSASGTIPMEPETLTTASVKFKNVKPAAPTFEPAAGEVPFGTVVELECEPADAAIYFTTDGTEPTEKSEEYSWRSEILITKAMTVKAIAIKDGYRSEVATAAYTVAPISAVVSISSTMREDTVGKNVAVGLTISDPETPASQGWIYTYPMSVYYTIDGTTEPSKEAYEAQADKDNGAIKMLAVKWEEQWGEYGPVMDGSGNYLAVMFSGETHFKAIGYMTVSEDMVVATPVLDTLFKVKSAPNPTFSLATYTKVAAGDKLVVKNPAPAPQPEEGEEGDDFEESEVSVGTLYFSFDGTKPTSTGYYGQEEDWESENGPYSSYKIFKVEDGMDVEVFFGEDEDGFYAYVPAITEAFYGMAAGVDTIRLAENGHFSIEVLCELAEAGERDPMSWGPAPVFRYGSDFVNAVYTMKDDLPVAAPAFSVAAGEVEKGTKMELACETEGAAIYYTVDGAEPTAESTLYAEAIEINEDMTVKAIAIKGDFKSEVATAAYTVVEPVVEPVAAPTFSVKSGEVEKGTKVEIACETEGAVIYYTVDGTEPTAESTEYKEAIEITGKVTIKAIAIKGELKSEVVEATYELLANEDEELAGVSVYPNPSNGVFNIELPVAATIEVFASNGVLTQRISANAGVATLTVNRSGIYFLRITGEGRTAIKRVIVR